MWESCWDCFTTIVKAIQEEEEEGDTTDDKSKSFVAPSSPNDLNTVELNGQSFIQLRDECLAENKLFVDPFGPPLPETDYDEVTWRRPRDISDNPQFFVDGFSRFDTNQGETNNCWFVVAAGNLTLRHKLFERVVTMDNCNFDNVAYTGIFHFRFWQYDIWYDVVIDDTLPTIENDDGKIMLLYMASTDRNEYWSALLEKAYAKLYGGYSIYTSGKTAEAMQDFTGGMTDIHFMEEQTENFFDLLLDKFSTKTMMVAEIDAFDKNNVGHAFSIVNVRKIEIADENGEPKDLELICLRNPWGCESQWGDGLAWNEKLPEWNRLSNDLLQRVNIEDHPNDGEFWMMYEYFAQHFKRIQFCNVFTNDDDTGKWNIASFAGSWTEDVPKPQFHIELSNPDNGGECDAFIGLVQKDRRKNRQPNLAIKFKVYEGTQIGHASESIDSSGPFINLREVSKKSVLAPGKYTIIPERHDSDSNCDFLLRIFTKATCAYVEV